MADHRPTLGSRLLVWRDPIQHKRACACGRVWPCHEAMEAPHAWSAGGGPIPDGAEERPPLDFIETAQGLYRLAHGDRTETRRPA